MSILQRNLRSVAFTSGLWSPLFVGSKASSCKQIRSFRSEGGLSDELLFYALRQPSPVTLREMFDFGKNPTDRTLLLAAQFLHEELPVRVAQRARELRRLPEGLSDMPSIDAVARLYEDSFARMRDFPKIKTKEQELEFTRLLSDIKHRHSNVQTMVAEGIQQLDQNLKGMHHTNMALDLSHFLNRFYMSRISIRMLIGQHVALHEPQPENFVGIIQSDCNPAEIAKQAAEDARHLCEYYYGNAPEIKVLGNQGITFQYIPTHLYYIFFELLKNSLRAVTEYHGQDEETLPQIHMIIAEGEEDVAIKVSDQGGGISRSGMSRIWTYTYTTALNPLADSNMNAAMMASPMAGFGHGLPLSRLYARYFGGDIKVISMEGFGTDAYVFVRKVGDVDEQLP